MPDGIGAVALPGAALLGAIALWWAATWIFKIDSFLVPSPPDVIDAFLRNPSYMLEQSLVTLLETLEGFALAVALGIPIAMAITASRLLERTVYPLLLAVNAVPKVAIAPILVVWMGFGQLPKVVMVVLLCIFPIVLSTAAGLRSTPAELVELADSLDTGALKTFAKFRFPFALPQIFVGLKTAISLAVIGAVIAEFVGADAGLGYLIVQSGSSADTALAFASMALLALMSIGLFYALAGIERRALPWAEEYR
ncbi:ABC transporter permease [Phycicoccus ginsengisoli]